MENLNIGIIAYSTWTGLGVQTLDYCNHLNPAKILLIDLSSLNGMEQHPEWYNKFPHVILCSGFPTMEIIEKFLQGLDLIFMAETPLNFLMLKRAREMRVKSIIHYNYEFLSYVSNKNLPTPDLLLAPTSWHLYDVASLTMARVERLTLPIDKTKIPERDIKETKLIGHIAGRVATNDRNGTMSFLNMVRRLGDSFNYVVYIQTPKEAKGQELYNEINKEIKRTIRDVPSLRVVYDIEDNTEMYKEMDLLVLPRRYGGLCIPMLESLSAGIPVIMPNISPNEDLLPERWLVHATSLNQFVTRAMVEVFDVDGMDLANKVLQMQMETPLNNERAKIISRKQSWEEMKPKYLQLFKEECRL
jgi:glycosyltransferase involved in cell wall biosynthesis